MTTQPQVGQLTPDADGKPSEAAELVEAYCAERAENVALEPGEWLRSRGGKASIGEELRIIDLLREASSLVEDHASVDTTHCWRPATPAQPPAGPGAERPKLRLGELLDGKLRILGLLGAGGMGEVYVAWHEVLEREVAVKVLLGEHADDDSSIGRFRKSIAMQARISSHQHIVGTLDAGIHRGHIYLVTEYVPGADLAAILGARHPLPWREVTEWVRQAAVGLDHAHQAGLVHRDIKPGNLILAADGTIKLLDWGLARAGSADDIDDRRTAANVPLGTYDFMPPEQARDAASADARSDLYSLGCTFYQLLAGRAPFGHHRSKLAKVQAHGSEPPPPLDTFRPDVPGRVQTVISRLLEKDPARRYATARELADDLAALLAGDVMPGVARRKPRRRVLMPIGVAITTLALVVAVWQLWERTKLPAELPQWVQLELLTTANADDENTPYDPVHILIPSGNRQSQPIRTFGGPAAFRLEGRFNRPTNWAVAWISDPSNTPNSKSHTENLRIDAEGSGSECEYPGAGANAAINKVKASAKPGVHDVILVLASDSPVSSQTGRDNEWLSTQLKPTELSNWPLPPTQGESVVWINPAGAIEAPAVKARDRAAGEKVARQTIRSYIQQIEARLPKGVRPLAAFFVRTEPVEKGEERQALDENGAQGP